MFFGLVSHWLYCFHCAYFSYCNYQFGNFLRIVLSSCGNFFSLLRTACFFFDLLFKKERKDNWPSTLCVLKFTCFDPHTKRKNQKKTFQMMVELDTRITLSRIGNIHWLYGNNLAFFNWKSSPITHVQCAPTEI